MNVLRVPRADIALGAAVTVFTVAPTIVPHTQPWWVPVLALLASAPVVWRRTLLVPAGLVTGFSMTVLTLAQGTLAHPPFLFLPYGPLVYTYTFAATAPPPLRAIGIAVLTAGVIPSLVVPHESLDTSRYVITAYVAAYAVGVSTRARCAQREAIEERTRRLEEERAAAVAEERTRIARDMHDIVTHSVGLMVVQAEAGPLIVRDDPAKAEAAFEAIAATGRDAIGGLRLILEALRGTRERGPQPSLDATSTLIGRARQAGLAVIIEEWGDRVPLPAAVDITAYRIVQECLTNALRHAPARTARLRLFWSGHALTIEVAGDGHGPRRFRAGHGIIGMRERVTACGGTLAIDPRGFTVTATLPTG